MNSQALLKTVVNGSLKKVPVVRPGYTVRVHQKIKEGGKERIQKFQGLVIKVNSGSGTDKTFTVRGTYSGVGVEKIFPLHSKNISKIDIVKKAKVRRAKLYYMRELTGRAARLQEQYVTDEDIIIDKDAPTKSSDSEIPSDDKKEEDDKGTDEIKADKDEKAEEAKAEEKGEKK